MNLTEKYEIERRELLANAEVLESADSYEQGSDAYGERKIYRLSMSNGTCKDFNGRSDYIRTAESKFVKNHKKEILALAAEMIRKDAE